MCNLLTLQTTVPEVNLAVQNYKLKQTVLMNVFVIIPLAIRALLFLTMYCLGYNKKNEVYTAIQAISSFSILLMVLILAKSKQKKLVHFAQFTYVFVFHALTIVQVSSSEINSKIDLHFLEQRLIFSLASLTFAMLGF